MSLGLRRREGETWLEAARRMAQPYGLAADVERFYHRYLHEGMDESRAAWAACCEWDVLEYRDDQPEEKP